VLEPFGDPLERLGASLVVFLVHYRLCQCHEYLCTCIVATAGTYATVVFLLHREHWQMGKREHLQLVVAQVLVEGAPARNSG
jgi:hypothetical protein